MAEWFQVFDDDRVLVRARARVRRRVVVFALVSGALVSAAPIAAVFWPDHAGSLAAACGVALVAYAGWLLVGLARLHRRLWRLELSVRRAVGHDAGGRRVSLAWTDLAFVDLRDDRLVLAGRDATGRRVRLSVGVQTPQFDVLARRAVEYAEAYCRPVHLDGRPLDAVSLAGLYPPSRAGSAPTV